MRSFIKTLIVAILVIVICYNLWWFNYCHTHQFANLGEQQRICRYY